MFPLSLETFFYSKRISYKMLEISLERKNKMARYASSQKVGTYTKHCTILPSTWVGSGGGGISKTRWEKEDIVKGRVVVIFKKKKKHT